MVEPTGRSAERSATVLVVSPDADVREVFAIGLTHFSFEVRVSGDPDAALTEAIEVPPAVVITNFPTTLADGRTLTEALRSDPRTCALPILNVTSHVTDHELAAARAAGVDASLPMPVTLSTLATEVGRLIGGS